MLMQQREMADRAIQQPIAFERFSPFRTCTKLGLEHRGYDPIKLDIGAGITSQG